MGAPMTEERVRRKLSGILSADAVGYSRLMQQDEARTISTLEESKRLMSSLIEQFKGRVVDAPGDNLLAEFGSVVDATECAVKIQKELKRKNAELPDNRKMQFRIGVNLGDVVEEADRIYGDGVNIAARMEGLAEAGGICISGKVYKEVKNKLSLGYAYLGEHSVKNIDEPVRVYRVQMETNSIKAEERKSEGRMAFPLPDEPSIAVLPFVNMSENPRQEFFCDGLTEGIIATLSKSPDLFVIARNSAFTYKDKPVKVQQVSQDLGVRYVLEGSVQKSGERVRITAQLIDALNGKHMWAERYDRDMKEIFTLQDEIAIHILEAMQWKLAIGSIAREALGKGTKNIEAYLSLVEGQHHLVHSNPEGFIQAKKLFEEAISSDPEYASPYIFLGIAHVLETKNAWSRSPKKSLAEASQLAKKAERLDKFHPSLYILLGLLKLSGRQYDKAMACFERAAELDPNNIMALLNKGDSLLFFQKMLRIDPLSPHFAYLGLGHANSDMENYEEAIFYYKKIIEIKPNHLLPHIRIAGCYAALEITEEARKAVAEVIRLHPKFSTKDFIKAEPYKDEALKKRWIANLLKAGLPL
jgi:adenylate cyclase